MAFTVRWWRYAMFRCESWQADLDGFPLGIAWGNARWDEYKIRGLAVFAWRYRACCAIPGPGWNRNRGDRQKAREIIRYLKGLRNCLYRRGPGSYDMWLPKAELAAAELTLMKARPLAEARLSALQKNGSGGRKGAKARGRDAEDIVRIATALLRTHPRRNIASITARRTGKSESQVRRILKGRDI